jgi:hypothetical protein
VSLEQVATDTLHRGRADVLIVTGEGTGRPTDPADVERVRVVAPAATLWVGSGVIEATAGAWRARCDGAIVGTALHQGGDIEAPLDVARVRAMRAAFDAGR